MHLGLEDALEALNLLGVDTRVVNEVKGLEIAHSCSFLLCSPGVYFRIWKISHQSPFCFLMESVKFLYSK